MEPYVNKIKCPRCGAVLAVKAQQGIENKTVTCPVCKESSPYKSYRSVNVRRSDDETCYPGKENDGHNVYENKEETEIGGVQNFTLGCLRVPNLRNWTCRLNPGRNVIGRKASASSADIRIPIEEGRRTSREHLIIDVKKVPRKGLVHYASLYKPEVNETFINHERLEYGDCVILKDGDKIVLPDATVIFEIPDEERTTI